jgi:hypothetical protein
LVKNTNQSENRIGYLSLSLIFILPWEWKNDSVLCSSFQIKVASL